MMKIGIIGTAGRKEDALRLDAFVFEFMKQKVLEIISRVCPNQPLTLISGGAAYADHVAVSLFLEQRAQKLLLHLPAPYNREDALFEDEFDGRTANYYHWKFSSICCGWAGTSLRQIEQAIQKGAETTTSDGFLQRNALVARDSDILIAFTFGVGAFLKRGGTSHTMSLFLISKGSRHSFHVNLTDKNTYTPAKTL